MNCPQARFLLYAHLDRELSRPDAEQLSRHLASCAPCAARAESARGLARVLRSRLDRAPAPARLRSRLQHGAFVLEPARPRSTSYVFAAALALLVVPVVNDLPRPGSGPAQASAPERIRAVTSAAVPLALVSKRVTGTFVCVQCETRQEAGYCPIPDHRHVPGFCADNGEIWRLMTREAGFEDAALGRAATLEGTAFPQSGFLRANRVGY
jgi:anti-sigma factor (TIGR02949 family)